MKTRIEQLKQKIREATAENPIFGCSPDCPPEVEEAFLERVLAFETSPKRTLADVLTDHQVALPRPQDLRDREISAKLWEIIHVLMTQYIVLGNTDHLSDRGLYTLLWKETLREEFVICPPELQHALHIDMTKTGEDDGIPIYLKYYASETDRRLYARTYPGRELPEHVKPPRRRDHLIPDDPSTWNKKHVN